MVLVYAEDGKPAKYISHASGDPKFRFSLIEHQKTLSSGIYYLLVDVVWHKSAI